MSSCHSELAIRKKRQTHILTNSFGFIWKYLKNLTTLFFNNTYLIGICINFQWFRKCYHLWRFKVLCWVTNHMDYIILLSMTTKYLYINHNTQDKDFNLLKQRSFCKINLLGQIIIWLGSSSQYKLLRARTSSLHLTWWKLTTTSWWGKSQRPTSVNTSLHLGYLM